MNECVGLWSVLTALPSPKSQAQELGDPVLASVNVTVKGVFPEMGEAVNAATGDVAARDITVGDVATEGVTTGDVTGEVTTGDAATEDVATGDAATEGVATGDAVTENVEATTTM